MSPPLTRETDLRDQRLQRTGGQLVGGGLAALGVAGCLAWALLGQGDLSAVALVPPAGMVLAGLALVFWSRGIEVEADPALPTFDMLPQTDPRRAQPLSVRRARWTWSATVWASSCCVLTLAVWLTKDHLPGVVRGAAFLFLTIGPTVWGARWLESANGESSWPQR